VSRTRYGPGMLRSTPFLAIPLLAFLVLATSNAASNRIKSTTVQVSPHIEMHILPLTLEGAIAD
jgi:hypothetical protein